jgi:hypothetical protein
VSATPTHSAAIASTSSSPATSSSATTMRRFFFGLFGIEQLTSPKRVEESEHDDLPQTLDVVPRAKIIQLLAQHLIAALGRHSSKDKCTAAARAYMASCLTASTGLIAAVHRGNDRNAESEYLRQLECVYLALDRLALPCAVDLRYDMSDLGWRCLPTSLFIQYVERDIFLLTDDLINSMLESLDADAADAPSRAARPRRGPTTTDTARIRAYLVTRLSNPTLCARYLRKCVRRPPIYSSIICAAHQSTAPRSSPAWSTATSSAARRRSSCRSRCASTPLRSRRPIRAPRAPAVRRRAEAVPRCCAAAAAVHRHSTTRSTS